MPNADMSPEVVELIEALFPLAASSTELAPAEAVGPTAICVKPSDKMVRLLDALQKLN